MNICDDSADIFLILVASSQILTQKDREPLPFVVRKITWPWHRDKSTKSSELLRDRPISLFSCEGNVGNGGTLWLFNSSPWYRWPIEIDGLPIKNGDFPWRTVTNNQRVPQNVWFILEIRKYDGWFRGTPKWISNKLETFICFWDFLGESQHFFA